MRAIRKEYFLTTLTSWTPDIYKFSNQVYKDETSLVRSQLLMAKLASFEGNSSFVMESLAKIQVTTVCLYSLKKNHM